MTTSTPAQKKKQPRGFVLLLVLVIAAAAIAIGMGVQMTAGNAQVSAIHATSGERAAALAGTGLDHADAYLASVLATEFDFDSALDPAVPPEANCTQLTLAGTGNVPEVGNMYLPTFGATVTLPAPWSKRFKRIDRDGGAYFVRFDDDNDDALPTTELPSATMENNTVGGLACSEGPTSIGVNNPARDRNGAMLVTVIGIHPGNDITKAEHRSVLRKLVTVPNGAPGNAPAAVQAGGNIQAGGGPGMEFCSDVAGLAAGGNIQISSGCACNEASAVGGFSPAPTTCGGCPTACAAVTQTAVPPAVPAPAWVTAQNVRLNSAWDFTSHCNFYMGATDLFYWNADDAACATFAGSLPDPPNACWVSLSRPWAPGGPEISGGLWRPRNATATDGPLTKPDWSTCPKAGAPSFFTMQDFRPAAPAGSVACTTCDGTNAVLQLSGGLWEPQGPGAATFRAYPVGVYFKTGNFAPSINWGGLPDNPGNQNDVTRWPMITFAIEGNFQPSGGEHYWIGVGSKMNDFASLISQGDTQLDNGSRVVFLGSVMAGGDVQMVNGSFNNSGFQFFGRIVARGDVQGGKMRVLYEDNLSAAGGPPAAPPPPVRMTMPLGL